MTIQRNQTEDNQSITVEGYAAVYDTPSKLIAERGETFYEVIGRGAFENALIDRELDVIATVNHDPDKMLARTISGTLRLESDERGLKYSFEVPNTTLGRDVAEMLSRGDFYESSFIAYLDPNKVKWERGASHEDYPTRFISDFSILRDVSIVTRGAYATTDVAIRASTEYAEIIKNEAEIKKEKEELNKFISEHKNEQD